MPTAVTQLAAPAPANDQVSRTGSFGDVAAVAPATGLSPSIRQEPVGGGQTRTLAWIAWALIAAFAGIVGFSSPWAFLVALPAGAYAVYLFGGGRDVIRQGRDGTGRSAIWLYWAAISAGAFVLGFAHAAAFLVALAAGAYATYLFRGGRWVFWIW